MLIGYVDGIYTYKQLDILTFYISTKHRIKIK